MLRRRFECEAKATAKLASPHTVTLYDFGVAENGAFYYVMELLHGMDLQHMVEEFGPMTPAPRGRAAHAGLPLAGRGPCQQSGPS